MFRFIINILFLVYILLSVHSCSSPTDVVEEENDNSFTPLSVGMIHQYFNFTDSSYSYDDIAGRAIREDGQEVFIGRHLSYPNPPHNFYQFKRDGFLYSTSLIKRVGEYNPFSEIRIAKEFPQNGDIWLQAPDSQKISITTHYIEEMPTPAGVIQDVVSYQFVDIYSPTLDTINVYYAKDIGRIGSLTQYGLVLLNYAKIGTDEYGELNPSVILHESKP